MFNKTYTIVINNENTDEAFKKLMMTLNKLSDVRSVRENKENGWIVIKLKTGISRWQLLIGKLKREMNLNLIKIGDYWFI